MAITVASVLARIQRRFPDCSDAVATAYVNEVHQDLLRQLPIVTATEDISLVAGTQEYAYAEATIKIVSAEYFGSATDRHHMFPTDLDHLNNNEPGWRSRGRGRPTRYYLWRDSSGNGVIGFDPTPVSTTSGGYPLVRLYQTRVETLTGASNLPEGILSAELYVYGAQRRFALDNRAYSEEVPALMQLEKQAYDLERKAYDERSPFKKKVQIRNIGMGGVR